MKMNKIKGFNNYCNFEKLIKDIEDFIQKPNIEVVSLSHAVDDTVQIFSTIVIYKEVE